MLNDLVGCRNAFQLLGYIFAELTQRTTAIRTAGVRRKMRDDFTRKIFRQRLARSTRPRPWLLSEQNLAVLLALCGLLRLQFFQLKLKLFQLPRQLLALAAEDHPPVLLDDQLQMFDQLLRPTCAVQLLPAITSAFNASISSVSRFGNRAEITTAVCHEHDVESIHKTRMNTGESLLSLIPPSRGVQVLFGLRQSMPSSSIESCARVRETVPLGRLWPDEAALLQTLGEQT